VKTASGKERLVIAVQTGVASVNAGISATRILDYFDEPKLAVLVGITAGLKAKKPNAKSPRLGDILVPTATIDVEAGKLTPKGKEKAGQKIPVSANNQRAVSSWAEFNRWSQKWKRSIKGTKITPKMFADCTLACTASVVGYRALGQRVLAHSAVREHAPEDRSFLYRCHVQPPINLLLHPQRHGHRSHLVSLAPEIQKHPAAASPVPRAAPGPAFVDL